MRLINGSAWNLGYIGYDWSSLSATYSSATLTTAYYLYFNPSDVNPSRGPYERYDGRPVRCLVYYVIKLIFVRSGDIVLDYETLRGYGESDYVWSRSAVTYLLPTSAKTYYLYFNVSAVRPSHSPVDRQVGFPVRC